jgi:hypothetical protein
VLVVESVAAAGPREAGSLLLQLQLLQVSGWHLLHFAPAPLLLQVAVKLLVAAAVQRLLQVLLLLLLLLLVWETLQVQQQQQLQQVQV